MSDTGRHRSARSGAWLGRQNGGVWFGLGILALAALYFWKSFDLNYQSRLGPGPGMYPRWLGAVTILVVLAYIAQSLKNQVFLLRDHFPGREELKGVAAVILASIAFIALLNLIGFVPASVVMILAVMYRSYRPWQALAWAVAISVVTWIVFKVFFSVPFPTGSLVALLTGGR